MRSHILTITFGHIVARYRLRGSRNARVQLAMDIVRAFARRLGVSPLAIDWSVS